MRVLYLLTIAVACAAAVYAAPVPTYSFARDDYTSSEWKAFGLTPQAGNVAIILFGDSNYNHQKDYNALGLAVRLAVKGANWIRSFPAPSSPADINNAISSLLPSIPLKTKGINSYVKTFIIAHGDAGPVVASYLASSADLSPTVKGASFLGFLPEQQFSKFLVPVQIVAGELDGISTPETVAYRLLDSDAASLSNAHVAILPGVTNAQFADGTRKNVNDTSSTYAVPLAEARARISLAVASFIIAKSAGSAIAPAAIWSVDHLSTLLANANAYAKLWKQARDYDNKDACIGFQTTVLNFLPTATNKPTMYNLLTPNYDAFVLSKAYVYSSNNSVSVSTYLWTVRGPNDGVVACKGKTQNGLVRGGLYPGDTSTTWGSLLTGVDVHKAQYQYALSLLPQDAVARFTASGASIQYEADKTAWANGPGFLASTGPFLFRSSPGSNIYKASSDTYRSPDTCPIGTPPQFCTADFLSAYYGKFIGARGFVRFFTLTALQD